MMAVIDLFSHVRYYKKHLYYQAEDKLRHKLIKKDNSLKDFLVVNITSDTIMTRDEFLKEIGCETDHYGKFVYDARQIVDSIDYLASQKYKVFKKIKNVKELL
jgi:predicted transcriptional regulator